MMGKPSKDHRANVSVSQRDAAAIALMLRLHATYSEEQACKAWRALDTSTPDWIGKPENVRLRHVALSWSRAQRKAQSFALQFEEIALNLNSGQSTLPDLTELR